MMASTTQGNHSFWCPKCNRRVIPRARDVGKEYRKTCPLCGLVLSYDYEEYVEYDRRKAGEELREEIPEEKIVIVCQNPDCRQELTIPNTTRTLRVTCPECGTSFVYPARATHKKRPAEATESENGDTQYPGLEDNPEVEEGEKTMATGWIRRHIFLASFLTGLPILVIFWFVSLAFKQDELPHKLMAMIVFLFVFGFWVVMFWDIWLDKVREWKTLRK